MVQMTEFGKEISKKLIDLGKPQNWLIAQVKEKTGLYFDSSYLYKIKTGQIATPSVVQAIREILGLTNGPAA